MRMNRWGFLGLGLAVVLALAGCTNTAAKRSANGLELDLKAGAHEGHAILRVISLRPVSMLNPKWKEVHLVSNGRPDLLEDVTPASEAFFQGRYFATESLYFSKLPAGTYEVNGFGSLGPSLGLVVMLMSGDSAKVTTLPPFTVEPGRLANLGTVVYAPAVGKEQPSSMILLQGPMGRKNALDALQAMSVRGEVPLPAGGGWQGDASPQNEQKLLAQARKLVSQLYLRTGEDGLAGGSHLGQVLQRTGRNQWARESLDTLSTVFAVGRAADGTSVAGSEFGTYFAKSPQGTWQPHTLPGDKGRIVFVEPYGKEGVILTTLTGRTSRFWVRDSVKETSAAPREVAKLETLPDFILSTPSELIIANQIFGISRESDFIRLDKTSFAASTQRHDFWVRGWQRFPDGEIRATRQNGNSLYRSKSSDAGKTWNHEQNASGASNYWVNQRQGYSMEYQSGFSTMTNMLQKTTDGGVRWQGLGTPLVTDHLPGSIIYADASEILVQNIGVGRVYSTLDEGKTWVQVFPPKP